MKPARRLAHRVVQGRAFVVDPRARQLHAMNAVGTRIWQLAGRGESPEAIAAALVSEFDVDPETAGKDCREFLDRLSGMGLLEG